MRAAILARMGQMIAYEIVAKRERDWPKARKYREAQRILRDKLREFDRRTAEEAAEYRRQSRGE